MNGLSPRASRFPLRLVFWAVVLTQVSFNYSATGEDKPAWQNGISTWNGGAYESPAASNQAPRLSLPTTENSPHAYTIPTDPNTASAVRKMSENHFAKNPSGLKILSLQPQETPLKLPTSTTGIASDQTKSNLPISPDGTEPWQRELTFPLSRTTPNAAASSEQGAANSNTLSSLPSDEFDEFLTTDPVFLSADASDKSDPARMPLPLTDPVTKTLQTENSVAEVQPDPGYEETSSSDLPPEPENQSAGWNPSEPAPLQTDVTRWYQYPQRWIKGWDSHAEFGLDGSDGNAKTLAMQAGMELKRTTDRYTLGIDINYRQASSRNKTTEQNGRFNINFDRLLGDTAWSAFAKHGMEWDKFKPFDLRLNLNGGVGYYWLRSDTSTLTTRFGAGASREIGAPIDNWIPEAVFGMEAERQLTSRQKLKGKIDYFPAWENFGNYRLVSDVSWEILLDGSENLSLKLAATDRYDSTPQGAKPNDVYYSLLLLYKF
jgi:putative salt-induced outer membrane protein YdiY